MRDSICIHAKGELPERRERVQADHDRKGACAWQRVDFVPGGEVLAEGHALEGVEPAEEASDNVRACEGQLGAREHCKVCVGIGHHRPEYDVQVVLVRTRYTAFSQSQGMEVMRANCCTKLIWNCDKFRMDTLWMEWF